LVEVALLALTAPRATAIVAKPQRRGGRRWSSRSPPVRWGEGPLPAHGPAPSGAVRAHSRNGL